MLIKKKIQKMKKNSSSKNEVINEEYDKEEYSDKEIELNTRALNYFFLLIFSFLTLVSILVAIISNF